MFKGGSGDNQIVNIQKDYQASLLVNVEAMVLFASAKTVLFEELVYLAVPGPWRLLEAIYRLNEPANKFW